MEKDIIDLALRNLENATHIKGSWKSTEQQDLNAEVKLSYDSTHIHLVIEVKKEIRNYHLPQLLAYQRAGKPFMLIAQTISPQLKEKLRENGIAYLDTNGNIWLSRDGVLIWIENEKFSTIKKQTANRAFTKTGLKVLFHFLQDQAFLTLPYREMASKSGVALGQIHYVINGLKEMGFLVKLTKNQYQLTNKKELLSKWLHTYEERLKPSLAVGKFHFLKNEDFENWKEISLTHTKSWWGGESAGELYTDYLKPAELTIYTVETRNELIKNYRLVPDPKGNVNVYKKFWYDDEVSNNVVPPLLAYTDLINTGDKRCIDTANLIYNEFFEDRLK